MKDGDRLLSEGAEVLVREILAAPPDALHCEVLVIGSGYGGAVAAARLAGAVSLDAAPGAVPIKVYLLERGSEYLPGEFPATFAELPGHVRFSMQDGKPARGNASGLFDLRLGGEVNALLGNGLGGGSLINAAVMERATPDAFEGGAWPAGLDLAALAEGYDKAEAMLALEQIPENVSKLDSLLEAGARMHGASGGKAHVAIAFADGTRTPAQVAMHRCLRCGDCVSGCNHRAKKSLDTNYLALAHARGARLFTGGTAYRIAALPEGAGYAVEFFFTDRRKARTDNARPYVVRARRVVVAAGTLGSTELLKRSEAAGLPVSRALGEGFSANGDMIAVAAGQHKKALSCAAEGDAPAERGIGPTITGLLRTHAEKHERPLVIEEFAIPAPLRRLLAEVVTTTDALQALAHTDLDLHAPDEVRDPLAVDDDMLRHTPVYGMMGDDGAAGSIELVGCGGSDKVLADAQVRVMWDKVATLPVFAAQMRALHAAHDGEGGLGGRVLPNPLWNPLPPFQSLAALLHPSGSVLTVHPLGGCRMADGPERGVVDSWGRVYDGAAKAPSFLPGLAVLDGSIVPVSLGINPSLTIAALAERALPVLAGYWGLALAGSPQPPPSERPLRRDMTHPRAPAPTRVSLRERMTGRVHIDGRVFALSAEVEFEPVDVPALRATPRTLAQPLVVLRFGKGDDAPIAHCSGTASMLVREKSDSIERILRSHALARKKLLALAEVLLAARVSTADLSGGDDGEEIPDFEGPAMADLMALCSHLGQVRLIEYDWTVERVEHGPPLKVGDRLRLTKRIAFVEGGNPWRQLSEGELQQIGPEEAKPLGRMVLDPSYFVEQLQPLLRVEHQQDMPNQLGDLAELALWVLRIVLQVHLLHFVPPPDSPQNDLERLPGEVYGVRPERVELVSAGGPGSTPPRLLSRYRPAERRAGTRPVMLIHGYGASGSTFAHKSIPGNLVQSLLEAGREVWVLELRTSIGFTGRPRAYWSFDEVAEADIPDALRTVQAAYTTPDDAAPVQVDVVAHCIGAAMFSVAVLRSPSLHASIGAVVLSQVGPLLRATAFNRFRGYVAGYLQQFIGTDEFDTRPTLTRMKRLLVDGLLATFPYPDDDGEAERLRKAPGFAAVRHRADAIFGQTMRLHNIGKDTLDALDSIYGFVKLRGLSQVGSYAREEVLTDAGGQGHAVGFEQLGERFGFPVFMLHGQRNAVFDWRGSYESFWLLKRVFGKDGGLSREPPELRDPSDPVGSDLFLGQGTPHQLLVLREYGHQDTLIGEKACTDVFPHIVRFLEAFDKKPGPGAPESPDWVARLPWTGPWLGHASRVAANAGRLHCRLALRPPPAHVSARAVVFVPAWRRDGRWCFDFEWMVALPTTRDKLLQDALEVDLFDERLAEYQGFAVLTAHDDLPMARGPIDVRGRRLAPGLFSEPQDEPIEPIREQVMRTLEAATDAQRERAVVRLDPAWIGAVQREGEAAQDSLCFALASCQYVPGLVDRLPAQASYRRLAQQLEVLAPPHKPQLLVLAGDQVYVDQTAGLFVPAGGDDVGQAYALTFRLEALRQVMASLPTYPLLDDHEVMDDWEPSPDHYGTPAVRAALDAYFAQQHKLVKSIGPDSDQRPFDYRISPAGFPFYMLDTRSTRQPRALRTDTPATPLDRASIRADAGMDDLKKWLEAAPAELPKFIVSPVALFPMPRAAAFGNGAERLGLDDWSGYPASQRALLELLRDTTARHVIVLSGDRHMSSVSSLWMQAADGPVEVISVVSSGLYAPWTFVNARPDAFWLDGEVELGAAPGAFTATMVTAAVGAAHGFAVLRVERGAGGHFRIDVTLDLDDGLTRCHRDLDPAGGSGWTVEGPARFARVPCHRPAPVDGSPA